MGQQQLLLIVLGVILVGVAVVLGIQYFGVGAEQGAKDEIVAHTVMIASNMQEYFKKPIAMGGGGNSFDNYVLPNKMDSTSNGTYSIGTLNGASPVDITGTPIPSYSWTVVTTVTDSTVSTVIQ